MAYTSLITTREKSYDFSRFLHNIEIQFKNARFFYFVRVDDGKPERACLRFFNSTTIIDGDTDKEVELSSCTHLYCMTFGLSMCSKEKVKLTVELEKNIFVFKIKNIFVQIESFKRSYSSIYEHYY